jgi:DNA-binding transcriptional LysR family regulator
MGAGGGVPDANTLRVYRIVFHASNRSIRGKIAMFNELFAKKGLTLERLRRFCEAAQAKSLIEAAGGDQDLASQLSRDIALLEEFFDCKLVTKTGRTVSGLTEQGERLRHLVTEYFNALIALQQEVTAPPAEVSIGAGETVLQWVICTKLGELRQAFQGIRLRLRNHGSAEVLRELEEGTLDVGIVDQPSLFRGANVPAHFTILPIGSIEYALFLTPELLERHRALSEREMLERLPLAGLEGLPSLAATANQLENVGPGFQLNFAAVLTSFPQVAQAVRTGELAGFLPTLAEADMARFGIVKVENSLLERLRVEIVLVYNNRIAPLKPYVAKAGTAIHTVLRGGQ